MGFRRLFLGLFIGGAAFLPHNRKIGTDIREDCNRCGCIKTCEKELLRLVGELAQRA